MLSKLRIGVDSDNTPVIEVSASKSEDLRDTMVLRFFDNIENSNGFAWVTFKGTGSNTSTWSIRAVNENNYAELQDCLQSVIEKTRTTMIAQSALPSSKIPMLPQDVVTAVGAMEEIIKVQKNLSLRISRCYSGSELWWEDCIDPSELGNPSRSYRVSPIINRSELEYMSLNEISILIIEIFSNIDDWECRNVGVLNKKDTPKRKTK